MYFNLNIDKTNFLMCKSMREEYSKIHTKSEYSIFFLKVALTVNSYFFNN